MINPAFNVPRQRIADLCRQHSIRSLALFGSVTRDDFRPDSDIDVLVEFEENAEAGLIDLVEIERELSELFGNRAVDVVTPAVFRNPYRKRAILKDLAGC